jgi:hypothetical protein
MVFFLLDFSPAQNSCVLLALKSELHLVTIENMVEGQEREHHKTLLNNIRTNKQKRQLRILLYCYSFQLCSFHLRNNCSVNTWDALFPQMSVKAQQNTFFIFYQFFS